MRKSVLFSPLPAISGLLYAAPFTMNGWQFHERDMPRLAEAIKRAPEYGVNFFIFSHGLFDHVGEFLNSESN